MRPQTSLKADIRARLASLQPRTHLPGDNRIAAVLMAIFERGGEPYFLLTRRTEEVQAHKGQVSFPGGMREGAETLQETALRETYEEVGILSDSIELLGRFHDYESSTGFLVTPFAGYLTEPFEISPQACEVAEVLLVPFGIFMDPERLRIEPMFRQGRVMDVYFYSYGKHQIWGLTARIIHDFLVELGLVADG
jgi:8-oxo-dGTP pyrophosphatase MutT (NUDIX family)